MHSKGAQRDSQQPSPICPGKTLNPEPSTLNPKLSTRGRGATHSSHLESALVQPVAPLPLDLIEAVLRYSNRQEGYSLEDDERHKDTHEPCKWSRSTQRNVSRTFTPRVSMAKSLDREVSLVLAWIPKTCPCINIERILSVLGK